MGQKYSTTNPFAPMKRASFETVEDTVEEGRAEYVEPEATDTEDYQEVTVPDGTAKEVLDWVGDDLDRALAALEVEEAKGDGGRKGLKRDLTDKLEN